MTDKDIDTSDIPPLDDDFFRRARCVIHRQRDRVTVDVDADVLDWFKSIGEDWVLRLNAALRIYMESHRQSDRQSAA